MSALPRAGEAAGNAPSYQYQKEDAHRFPLHCLALLQETSASKSVRESGNQQNTPPHLPFAIPSGQGSKEKIGLELGLYSIAFYYRPVTAVRTH